ncbi:META domain-containing protein [Neisseria montereyensis]|uniref:META domain-containing protein n=1 Tax=Neisseria montereyensis TaxID=2973938 RepID=A0ABT2FGN1_9NEIS|nr:META domain-containing protein [Neisseria montereyensis]MCS4534719.1 META domain-containing protein [Neisseria montereyensis]
MKMKLLSLLFPVLLGACVVPIPIPLPSNTAATAQALEGDWQITEAAGRPVNVADAVLSFHQADKRFSATTGCNTLFGGYTDGTNNTLRFDEAASTMMACPDMETEQRLANILPQVRAYRFNGNNLEMTDSRGAIVIRGVRKDK